MVITAAGFAAEPGSGKGGGLVPGSSMPRAGLTREELLREWDLDGDGTISKPEADVARGRMRRKRLDMQLGAGVDPITGLPRDIDTESTEPAEGDEDEPVFRLPPEDPPPAAKPRAETSPPGMRAPAPAREEPAGVAPTAPAPAPTSPLGQGGQPATAATPTLSGRASWLPPQPMAPAMTGGVRAGAPAAVPGYGSGPWSSLNAGRRPAGQPAGGGGADRTGVGGGLVPGPRLPGRTGALILPNASRAGASRTPATPPAPATPTIPEPRITAEDIGGYRP
ncbi:MAG: hypothetical protein ACKOCX_08890 [Planctomycetota bacterium]